MEEFISERTVNSETEKIEALAHPRDDREDGGVGRLVVCDERHVVGVDGRVVPAIPIESSCTLEFAVKTPPSIFAKFADLRRGVFTPILDSR